MNNIQDVRQFRLAGPGSDEAVITQNRRPGKQTPPIFKQQDLSIIGGAIGLFTLIALVFYYYRNCKKAFNSTPSIQNDIKNTKLWQKFIIEKMVDGVITISEKGIILTINPAGERIFGYSADEIVGKNIKILMPSPYREEHDAHLETYLRTGKARVIGISRQVEGLRKDGRIFPLYLAVSEININGSRLFTGIVRDITEHIEADKAIQASASKLQTVLDNVVDGIITINSKGIVRSFNPAAENIFGYTAKEMIGNNITMLMPPHYRDEHDSFNDNNIKSGKAHVIGIGREVEGMRKDGSIFPLDLAVSKTLIDGEIIFTGIARDITERKQIEKMKNEFISTVSHEIRTPLTSIRGSLGLVMGGTVGELPAGVKEMLAITANNTERLLLLINDILDIQKIESGMMQFRFHSLEIKPFLQQAIQANQSYADQYGVAFKLNSCQENMRVYADADRLMQVMNNLMSNATKFSPKGEKIEISATKYKGTIRISVADHGPGIASDFRDKLFDKFTQYDSTDTRQKGGTGLGLSISRLIIDKHGGRIDFVSRPRVGTTFYVELPELISDPSSDKPPLKWTG